MANPWTCRCGHTWTADRPAGGTAAVCPRCGASADATVSLDSRAGSTDQTVPAASADAASPPPEVSGYTILGELGRGGMGVVYRARQASLNRVVALKVLLAGAHAGERDLARFRAEAEAAAAIQHPNVVSVYAVGANAGLPFLAQELVPGGSLAARLEGGPLDPIEAARLVEAIARGVQAAHDRGVIHRDLKPANVLFTADGEPKVADFGLAKVGDSGLTATGAVMGTPAYMAPEQARGDTRHVGPATDVWALGAILYECLTGRPPFRGNSAPETFRLVCEADPRPLLGVPTNLATVVLKCLEKDPARRYSSAAAVAGDLGRFRSGEPISARRPGRMAQLARWARRHPGLVYVAAGAILAAAVVYAVYPRPKPDAGPTPIVQQPPPVEPEDEPPTVGPGALGQVRIAANRMVSANNVRELAIAAHNMEQTYGRLPADAIYDAKTGKPLLSWRVAYLPFIEEGTLYEQFKLDEPWDSQHNRPLVEKMPKKFTIPDSPAPPGHTYYQVFTGPGTMFDPAGFRPGPFGKLGLAFTDVTDGTVNTVLMAEAAKPVIWTKPEDMVVVPGQPLPARGGVFPGGYNVAMVDGHIVFVSDLVSEEAFRAALSPRGGETLGPDWPDGPKEKK